MLNLYKKPLSGFWAATLPAIYIVLVLVSDRITPQSTITPALCTVGILMMAFCFPVRWVIIWVSIYTATVYCIFHVAIVYAFLNSGATLPDDFSFNIRTASFLSVGIFSVYFSILLRRFRQISVEQDQIIGSIPDPLVTTDSNGRIIFANNTLLELTGFKSSELIGQNFFDMFAPVGTQGAAISNYIQILEGKNVEKPLHLKIREQDYIGQTVHLNSKAKLLLLIIFRNSII